MVAWQKRNANLLCIQTRRDHDSGKTAASVLKVRGTLQKNLFADGDETDDKRDSLAPITCMRTFLLYIRRMNNRSFYADNV